MKYLPIALASLALVTVASPAAPADEFFDSNGVSIHYIDCGNGPAVILVHGWAMDLTRNWVDSLVADKLAEDFRVIAIDCRSMGKSESPAAPEPEAYGMEMVDDVVRLMDHLQLRRAHVVGFSMGAFITWRFQMSYPERTISATHIDIPLPGKHDGGRQRACEEAARRYEAANNFQAAACMRGYEAWGVTDAEARASTVPTMLLRGAKPDDVQEDWPNAHSRIVPGLRLVYLSDAHSHTECFSSPGAIGVLKEFLADTCTAAAATPPPGITEPPAD
jgi:pimeloyl-ACP methyl ester carboxylesterase